MKSNERMTVGDWLKTFAMMIAITLAVVIWKHYSTDRDEDVTVGKLNAVQEADNDRLDQA